MHYLKCTKCGHFNEVKSEYMVFCPSCNKKLENNFAEWNRKFPEKSFDEFKNEICTTKQEEALQVKPRSGSKPLKGILIGIGVILFIGIIYAIGSYAGNKIISLFQKPVFDQMMMLTASEINKTCPIMVDAETRMDNAVALPDHVFQYNYTLINIEKASIDTLKLKTYLEPTIVSFVKTSPQMKFLRDNKTRFNYCYRDKAGKYMMIISVNPGQYQ